MYTTIKTLWNSGQNKSEISRSTGHDWKTVNKVIKNIEKGIERPVIKEKPSILEPYKSTIIDYLEKGLTGVRIHEELQLMGVSGTYSAVKKYIRKIKKKEKIFVRIHTPVGQEAQVDFGYVGKIKDENGKLSKTWVFNMRLSYSRYDYYEIVTDQRVETFIGCHIRAFEYFGGVPEIVKIDNLKAAILEANFYEPVYQTMYKNFADYTGFNPVPCRVYRPNDKGKVESGIKYIKNNFFNGRNFKSTSECRSKLEIWLEKANRRIHGTTRKIPKEIFTKEEQSVLKTLPIKKYSLGKGGTRKVYHDCHVFIDYNYYSVPYEYVGTEVEIEVHEKIIKIFHQGKQIAMHYTLKGEGLFSTEDAHYPKYKIQTDTEYQDACQQKMAQIGNYAEQFFFSIRADQKAYWYNSVKGILSLTKTYPNDVINLSCKRALAYEALQYQTVKNICKKGLYNLPLDSYYCVEVNYEHN